MKQTTLLADASYLVEDDGLAVGSTLGGSTLCTKLLANGAIDAVHSTKSGKVLVRGFDVHFWNATSGVRIAHGPSTFELRPERQIQRLVLGNTVQIEKTTHIHNDATQPGAPEACYVSVTMRNLGTRPVVLASVAICRLKPSFQESITTRFHERDRALEVASHDGSHRYRIVVSEAPHSWAVTSDHGRMVAARWQGPFHCTADAGGMDPIGALHLQHTLAPGSAAPIWFAITECEGTLLSSDASIQRTSAYFASMLDRAQMLSPVEEADCGVYWAKANMLRVMRSSPTGLAFTNDPGRSNHCVGRDSFWFVHGCDWLFPEFSRQLLQGFADRQEDDGKIVEYYDLLTGETADDGLDVNDNTPLFVLAVWHHALATGDQEFLRQFYDSARRAVEQLLAHRDRRGLIWCSADGTGARGIVGWRNVIRNYRISGATTELNSETYAALVKMVELATIRGRDEDVRRYREAAADLRAAIESHLRNPQNGLYYLNIDVDGEPSSEVTADLVFPVIFGVADEATSVRIIERLRADDFWTDAGVRTVSRRSPQYSPTSGSGLLGGVWVAVTFWYAFAAARFVPNIMLESLQRTFAHYARHPKRTNTVPGEFSEWLNGETLVNEGMTLSPWFPPRYLWAAIEGACGLTPSARGLRIDPNLPSEWLWLGARNVRAQNSAISWFVVREHYRQKLYVNHAVTSDTPTQTYEWDVTGDVVVEGDRSTAIALANDDQLVILVGNRGRRTATVSLELSERLRGYKHVRIYESFQDAWQDGPGDDNPFVLSIAQSHFALIEANKAASDPQKSHPAT